MTVATVIDSIMDDNSRTLFFKNENSRGTFFAQFAKEPVLFNTSERMGSVLSYFFGYPDDDVLDPATGLTGKQKRIVKETWSLLRANSVNTGVTIMIAYFEKYPQYQKVFPAFKDIPLAELSGNKKFQAHCQNIMASLSSAFDAMDDAALMEATLYSVGERHGRRGQGRQEFIDLKGVILDVMKVALGPKFSQEVEATWDKTIDVAYSQIFKGIESQSSS